MQDTEGPPVAVERKFTASRHRLEAAICLLGRVADPDPDFARGTVHSIYFDTPRLAAYGEKLNGDFLKRKIRLRWYGEPTGGRLSVFLEFKDRLGGGRRKRRLRMEWPSDLLAGPDLSGLALAEAVRAQAGDFAAQIPPDFLPMLGLRYERRRYICRFTGARMCLDAAIQVTQRNAQHLPGSGWPALTEVVFEFKDVGQVEVPWLGELAQAGFTSRSFSKYGECLRRVLEGGAPS